MRNHILSILKTMLFIALVFGAGFGAGFCHQKTLMIERAVEVLTPARGCYEVQDIEIIIFGEPQL